jgi:LemA protein
MRGALIAVIVVVLVLLGLGGCVAGSYNQLVRGKADVDNRWAQVDNQLKRRGDLIVNLVQTVKGGMMQEQAVFGKIADARAAMAGAKTAQQSIAAAQGMDSAIGRLLVVIENYPQLKSQDAVRQLMDELAGTENRLATERMRYNDTVRDYNVLVRSFPMTLFAGMFHYDPAQPYPVAETDKATPKVDFSDVRPDAGAGTTPGSQPPAGSTK